MRKYFKLLHLIFGLLSGLVIFTIALSGSIVSYDEEIRDIIYSNLQNVENHNGKVKSIDELCEFVKKNKPNLKIKAIRIHNDSNRSVEFILKNRKTLYINQYNSKIIGIADKNNDFLAKILKIHRSFYLDDTGKWITSIATLIFLFMIISGFVLWFPKTVKSIKNKFLIRWNVHKNKRMYDLHNVLGFYSSVFLLLTVLTGLIFSFKWAENSLYLATGSKKEKRLNIKSISKDIGNVISIQNIYNHVKKEFPAHSECILNLPEKKFDSFRLMCRYKNSGFYRRIDNMFVDQYSGKILKIRKFSELSAGLKLRISAENIHTGESFGFLGQFIVFISGLICASLPITGFLLWKNKNFKI